MNTDRSLEGRVAVITGAANGLGASIAYCLSAKGAFVALSDIDSAKIQTVGAGIPDSLPLTLDVGDPQAVKTAIEQVNDFYGRVDILINNAGFQRVAPIAEYLEDDWNAIVQTILTGTFLCTKYSLPYLRKSGYGRVVNIASVHGLVASPYKAAYVAAKHGVVGFTKALALEEAENNVTANAVCPGYLRTALAEVQIAEKAKKNGVDYKAAELDLLKPMSIKRLFEPDEVSELVAYLSSDLACGMTGSVIPIDGGWTAQ